MKCKHGSLVINIFFIRNTGAILELWALWQLICQLTFLFGNVLLLKIGRKLSDFSIFSVHKLVL